MMSRLADEIDKQIRDSEDKLTRDFSGQIEFSLNEMQANFDTSVRQIEEKMQLIQLQSNQFGSRERRQASIKESLNMSQQFDPAKMEAALNEWLVKVEE
jgi:CRISPR/Cas system-associated protein Cas10 (large subunit of type III CRISPR-Cas system)